MTVSNSKINICLACDNNYAKHAGVVIASILHNATQNDQLAFFILDGNIDKTNKEHLLTLKKIKDCEINFIQINDALFKDYKKIKTHSYITLAAYYRLKIASLLPQIDKVIYFDCDFVINTSLQDLYNSDMGGMPIAGVLDIKKKKLISNPTYINSGMLIFDLKKMREINLETMIIEWANKNTENITCGDQEIINEVCKGQISILADEWNVQSSNFTNRSSYTNTPKCIHFVSAKKPWHFGSYSYHKKYYFKYLQLTPWALKGYEKIVWGVINELISCIKYIGYRPLFLLRPKFYQAFFYTYIKDFIRR